MANNYTAQTLIDGEWVDVLADERFFDALNARRRVNTAYPDHSARILRNGTPIEARKHPGGWAGYSWFDFPEAQP